MIVFCLLSFLYYTYWVKAESFGHRSYHIIMDLNPLYPLILIPRNSGSGCMPERVLTTAYMWNYLGRTQRLTRQSMLCITACVHLHDITRSINTRLWYIVCQGSYRIMVSIRLQSLHWYTVAWWYNGTLLWGHPWNLEAFHCKDTLIFN